MAAKQKIMIVDDDSNIAELISLYLTKECFDSQSEIAIKAVRCPHCTSKLEGFPEAKL